MAKFYNASMVIGASVKNVLIAADNKKIATKLGNKHFGKPIKGSVKVKRSKKFKNNQVLFSWNDVDSGLNLNVPEISKHL